MSKWQGLKQYEGLLWKVHNNNLFSFKPDDDEIVQSVYHLNTKNKDKSFITYHEIAQGKPTIICEANDTTCKEYWDSLCDKRVDPKMHCSMSLQMTIKR